MTHDSEELLDICSVVFFCSLFQYPEIRSDTVCLEVPHGWPCVKLQMPCSCWAGMAAGPAGWPVSHGTNCFRRA